jgi:hypothetical protein
LITQVSKLVQVALRIGGVVATLRAELRVRHRNRHAITHQFEYL